MPVARGRCVSGLGHHLGAVNDVCQRSYGASSPRDEIPIVCPQLSACEKTAGIIE